MELTELKEKEYQRGYDLGIKRGMSIAFAISILTVVTASLLTTLLFYSFPNLLHV